MIAKSDMPNINDKPPEGVKAEGGAYRVLVVDDSMFIAKQLGQIFTSEGFEVAGTAADGAQGVEKYKELTLISIWLPWILLCRSWTGFRHWKKYWNLTKKPVLLW
jgi:PleD family two-component response regulator